MLPQDARDWYRDCEACGWSRADGRPYDNWRREMTYHRDRLRSAGQHSSPNSPAKAPGGPAKPLSVWEASKRREIAQERLKAISDAASHTATDILYTPEQREERKKLRQIIKETTAQLLQPQ